MENRASDCLAGNPGYADLSAYLTLAVFLSHGFPFSTLKLPFQQLPFLISQ